MHRQGGLFIKILVTGGAGFIGSHLSDQLINYGHDIVIIDDLSSGKIENINPRAKFYRLNLNDDSLVRVFAVEKPQIIYHLAAQINVGVSQQEPCLDADSNIMGTIKLLTYAIKYKVKKIVFTSSAAIYGNPLYLPVNEEHPALPLSFYGLSKYTAECYIRMFAATFGLRYSILRFSNVYGPRQQATGEGGVITQFIARFSKKDAPVIYGNGEQTRDFIYVGDVVTACCKALYMGYNQTLNISTGRAVSINQLCQQLKNISDWSSPPFYYPRREGDILHSVLDNSKARSQLLWYPRSSLTEGLKKTIYSEKQKTTLTEW